jgi:two-component system sensor histidine kinase UhpB
VVVLLVGLLVLLAVDVALLRRALRPLSRLVEDMRTVDLLVPGRRVPRDGPGRELIELSGAFNDMIDRLEHERQASATATFDASESERLRIARELHDQTSQDLTALVLIFQRDDVDGARDLAEEILVGVRTIITKLRPEPLEELGWPARSLGDRASRTAGIPVGCTLPAELPVFTPATQWRSTASPRRPSTTRSAMRVRGRSRSRWRPTMTARAGSDRRGRAARRRYPGAGTTLIDAPTCQ